MPEFATYDDLVEHSRRVGHPAGQLPQAVRDAYAAAGMQAPQTINLQVGVITPPHAGDGKPAHCVHCGADVPEGQHERAHAVEGFEQARHVETNAPLRLRVFHCDQCIGGDGCSMDTAGGYCHAVGEEV